MSNKLIRVFDNIGFNFIIDNNDIKPVSAIKTYNILNSSHVGYLIPYIARNVKDQLFETGVGEILFNSVGDVIIKRLEIISSSNNNNLVNFPALNNEFYVFANRGSFDKSLSNTIVVDKNRTLDAVNALYLIDSYNSDITLELPDLSQSNNLILEFKLIDISHSASIKFNDNIVCTLNSQNNYVRLASTGEGWVVLNNKPPEQISIQSTADNSFSILSTDQISTSDIYWDTDSKRVYIGGNSQTTADTIIPTTGSYPFIVNNNLNGSDFIVYGSGSVNKNLFFTYDGRVGVNIPSGSRPSTVFHIVNTVCQEGLRLENRSSCYPTNITLYHKPSSDIVNGSIISQLNLAAKNSTGNQINYAKIEARALNTIANSEKGSYDITVVSGVTGIRTIQTSVDNTHIGYSGNRLEVNNNGNLVLNNNSKVIVSPQSITLSSPAVYATGTSYLTTISAQNIEASNIEINNLGSSGLLMISGGQIVNSPISVNSLGSLNLPITPNKLLSTTSTGAVTGIYSLDDYFLTEQNIKWNVFPQRNATICSRQVTFSELVPSQEFGIGDQIEINASGSYYYRLISDVVLSNNLITELLIDQTLPNSSSNISLVSVTKGGFLSIAKTTEDGTETDSTNTIISVRPNTNTVFNTNQKDIDFIVYGNDPVPALYVKANTGRSEMSSGIYYSFASGRDDIFPILINSGVGSGVAATYSSANYKNSISGIVTSVGSNGLPSYYGTYDQNGNVSEWIEQSIISSINSEEFTAGGSFLTNDDKGLKCYESLPKSSGYEYVGFRIASSISVNDVNSIIGSNTLNFEFKSINNPKNISDNTPTYRKVQSDFIRYFPNNLGHVDYLYRISKYEVTNRQYCRFLNAVAVNNDRSLYDVRMSGVNGGIIKTDNNGVYSYSLKTNMDNKPVNFVSYPNAIKFINWLDNGAKINYISENDIDNDLNIGSYTIQNLGNNSYRIDKRVHKKYWLPDINEWHKAAYYKPINATAGIGSPSVTINRESAYVVASGTDITTGKPSKLYADLTVNGWLYADHIVIGDGTVISSKGFTNINEITSNNVGIQSVTSGNLDPQWNSSYSMVSRSSVSCVSPSGCNFAAKPFRLNSDSDNGLCNNVNNTPWWCSQNNIGPGWFI